MGGYGSSRWNTTSTRRVVEHCSCLDINRLRRQGLFNPGFHYNIYWKSRQGKIESSIGLFVRTKDLVELSYTTNGKSVKYTVPVEWTPCNYGGERPYFLCPGRDCGRRVSKLYISGRYFLCRDCQNLSYKSQREQHADRLIRKKFKIADRLTPEGDTFNAIVPVFFRPKGMREKTYQRLLDEYRELDYASTMALCGEVYKITKNPFWKQHYEDYRKYEKQRKQFR